MAEILPIESADMLYYLDKNGVRLISESPFVRSFKETNTFTHIYCWSLAALLDVLPEYHLSSPNPLEEQYCCRVKDIETYSNNLVNTCYEMIIRLHELKML